MISYTDLKFKFLNRIPGVFFLLIILLPLYSALYWPELFDFIFLGFLIYWVYKSTKFTLGLIIGFYRYKKTKQVKAFETDLKHLIVIPHYGEDLDTISKCIASILNQDYDSAKIYIVVSMEARKIKVDDRYATHLDALKARFGRNIAVLVHELSEGEVAGAASNRAYAAKVAVELIKARGEDIRDFLITSPDGDTIFPSNYISSVTRHYLSVPNPERKFFQSAIYKFRSVKSASLLIRIFSLNLTLAILSASGNRIEKRETFSCFTMNLGVLEKVGFWDHTIAIDDTNFYWRAYDHLNGDWQCEVVYTPIFVEPIKDSNLLKTLYRQFLQAVRWSYGMVSIALASEVLWWNKNVSLLSKISKLIHLFDFFLLNKAVIYILTFGLPIYLLVTQDISRLYISQLNTQFFQLIFTVISLQIIPITMIKILLIYEDTKKDFLKISLLSIFEIPFNIIAIILYNLLPSLITAFELALGFDKVNQVKWSEKRI